MKILILFFLIAHILSINAISCDDLHDCKSVTKKLDFVACINGQCECKTTLGFKGKATKQNKCSCNEVNILQDNDEIYCLPKRKCLHELQKINRIELLKEKVREVYTNLIYPTSTQILAGLKSVDHLFSSQCKGRIDPVGEFNDFLSLKEYYYGLAANPVSRVTSIHFVELFGIDNKIFVRVDIYFENLDPSIPPFNLTQSGRYVFDEQDLILSGDLIIHNLGAQSDPKITDQQQTIQTVCGILMINPGREKC